MADPDSMVGDGKGIRLQGGDRRQGSLATVHCSLVLVQLGYGGASVLAKVAVSTGVNPFVFAVYRDLVALAVLIPTAYLVERDQRRPLTFPVLGFMLGIGLTGVFGGQCLTLIGLSLSSVSMAAAVPVMIPVFTFIISLLFGVENIDWKTRPGQAKALAIVLTISGAMILCLVKGAAIVVPRVPNRLTEQFLEGELSTESLYLNLEPWQLGDICMIFGALSFAVFTVLQAPALARYPAPISLVAFSYVFGAIMLALTGLATVKDSSSWVINRRSAVISLVYAGLVSSFLNFIIQAWSVQRAGPLLVAFYIPLQSFATAVLAYLFLGETIFLGSIMGAALIGTGLYLISWAKAKTQQGRIILGDICLPENAASANQINLQQPLLRYELMPSV